MRDQGDVLVQIVRDAVPRVDRARRHGGPARAHQAAAGGGRRPGHEQNKRSLVLLTVFTVLALPINIIAGRFGMNVGGIPLADDGKGFWIIVGLVATDIRAVKQLPRDAAPLPVACPIPRQSVQNRVAGRCGTSIHSVFHRICG